MSSEFLPRILSDNKSKTIANTQLRPPNIQENNARNASTYDASECEVYIYNQ